MPYKLYRHRPTPYSFFSNDYPWISQYNNIKSGHALCGYYRFNLHYLSAFYPTQCQLCHL